MGKRSVGAPRHRAVAGEPGAGARGVLRGGSAPQVAIVGRPNVGKSTLFNRLVGGRPALVHDTPGVTRDRNVALVRSHDRELLLVDTGGFEAEPGPGVEGLVRRQSWEAVTTADVTIFVLDGRAGLSPADREAVSLLRRSGRSVVYVVNKIDTPKQDTLIFDFSSLGVEPLIPISAEHDVGVDELMTEVLARLPEPTAPAEGEITATRLALVGRPNVGKSSLLNRLTGTERSIVDETPGTTRDPVDTPVVLGAHTYLLIDTAGIRRRSRVDRSLERLSVLRSLRTIERAEVVLVVLDALEGMTDQDARIAAYARRRGRGLALLVNKWDLRAAEDAHEEAWLAEMRERRPAFAETPVLCVSALSGWHLDRVPSLVERVERDFSAELPTSRLNQVLRHAAQSHTAPAVGARTPRFYYATQVGTRPPTVAVFTSDPGAIHAAYVRYLRGQFSRAFGIRGAAVRLEFRARR